MIARFIGRTHRVWVVFRPSRFPNGPGSCKEEPFDRLPDHRSAEGADYQLPCSAIANRSRPSRYEGSPEGGSVIVVQEVKAGVGRFVDDLVVATLRRQFHSREPPG